MGQQLVIWRYISVNVTSEYMSISEQFCGMFFFVKNSFRLEGNYIYCILSETLNSSCSQKRLKVGF